MSLTSKSTTRTKVSLILDLVAVMLMIDLTCHTISVEAKEKGYLVADPEWRASR